MNRVNIVLQRILNKKYDFCCLCFKTILKDPIRLQNEVVLFGNQKGNVSVSEIMSSIFDDETFNYISAIDALCKQCTKSAMTAYRFLTQSKENSQYLCSALEQLTNSLEATPNELDDCKTLFVSLNPELHTSNQYYDNVGFITNPLEAFKRFQSIVFLKETKKGYVLPPKSLKETKKGCVLPPKSLKETKKGYVLPPKSLKKETTIKQKLIKTIKETKIKQDTEKSTKIRAKDMLDSSDPNIFKCKECFKIYPSIGNLRNHFVRVHAPKDFKCPECPRRYASLGLVFAHKEQSHVTIVCSECGKTFRNRHTLKMHEKSHYLRLVCPDCGRVYKNHNTFKIHIDNNICQTETRRSPANAKFTCDYCQKKYTQKITLRVHIQYEHLNYKYHICKWCKKKFWCQSRLKAHIVKHTKERNFICSICNGKFVTKESLLYHTRIHTGERPYPCPHCESRFLSASRRAAHVKSQHMDPTVECDICHSKFKSYHYLQKHKKIHSSKDSGVQTQTGKVEEKSPHYPKIKKPYTLKNNVYSDAKSIKLLSNPNVKGNLGEELKLHYNNDPVYRSDNPSDVNVRQMVEFNQAGGKIAFMYQVSDGDGESQDGNQAVDGNEEVYLEMSEEDEYEIKVSEIVEV